MKNKSKEKLPSWQKSIEELRGEIDQIDRQLVNLVNRRMSLAGRIGKLKQENGKEIFDPDRESQLLKTLTDANPGPIDDSALHRIFREILLASKTLQNAERDFRKTKNYATANPASIADEHIIDQTNIDFHCLIGDPVSHSLGPVMMNTAFRMLDMSCLYAALPVPASVLEKAVMGIRGLGIRGVSVTIPHKTAILAFLDEIDPLAQQIGAVNTILNRNGQLFGYNTDAEGALSALQAEVNLRGKKVAIIGAGGAARAIGFAVYREGADVLIVNRTEASGKDLAAALSAEYRRRDQIAAIPLDVLINTTPVGMDPDIDSSPVDKSVFKAGMVVMDAVYNPRRTKFLQSAEASGCIIIEGIEMFVRQGARQFEIWTGKKAPVDCMREAVIGALRAPRDG